MDAIESSYMLAKRRKGVTFSVKDFYDCLPAAGVAHPELGGNVETVMALGKSRGLIDERKGDTYRESCKPSTLVMVSTGDDYRPTKQKNFFFFTYPLELRLFFVVQPEPKKCRSPPRSSIVTRVKGFAKISDLSDAKTLKKILYKVSSSSSSS